MAKYEVHIPSNLLQITSLFPMGHIVATRGALSLVEHGINLGDYLRRHAQADWGDVVAEDKMLNLQDMSHGGRLVSAYQLPGDLGRLLIITEADRSATTLLMSDEY